jgi:hypothetical protein
MDEEASASIWAKSPLCVLNTRFLLILIDKRVFSHQFMFSMGKLTLVSISASTFSNPVFAHLSFVMIIFVYPPSWSLFALKLHISIIILIPIVRRTNSVLDHLWGNGLIEIYLSLWVILIGCH